MLMYFFILNWKLKCFYIYLMVTSKYVIAIFVLFFKRKCQLFFLNKNYSNTKYQKKTKNQNQKQKTKTKTKNQKPKSKNQKLKLRTSSNNQHWNKSNIFSHLLSHVCALYSLMSIGNRDGLWTMVLRVEWNKILYYLHVLLFWLEFIFLSWV